MLVSERLKGQKDNGFKTELMYCFIGPEGNQKLIKVNYNKVDELYDLQKMDEKYPTCMIPIIKKK